MRRYISKKGVTGVTNHYKPLFYAGLKCNTFCNTYGKKVLHLAKGVTLLPKKDFKTFFRLLAHGSHSILL